jgi:hypothetical protein
MEEEKAMTGTRKLSTRRYEEEPLLGGHPGRGELVLFMLGKLSGAENRAIVRHLLPGCSICTTLTRELWSYGEKPPKILEERSEGSGLSLPTPGSDTTSRV